MGKTKKNRRNMADRVRNSRAPKEKKINPFELRINKQKHVVLGRNQNVRGQVGNPGQSRSKANKQRCETLLVELNQSKKSNVFKDQRLGEKVKDLSQDEKDVQRFAFERMAEYQRHGNLEDDREEETLTHAGQSISQIEKFDDVPVDSDSDDEDGRLGGRITDEHFGGFLKEKKPDDKLSWKERMAQLIAQTRKEKYERQSEKDLLQKQVEDVDAEFKAIHHLMMTKRPNRLDMEKPKADEYDIKVRAMQFEMRGKPSDRLKTEEELAQEEAERLKKLEDDRKRRMKGELASQEAPTHISADSLDDGLTNTDIPEVRFQLFHDTKTKEKSDDDENEVDSDEEEEGDDDEEEDDEDADDDDSDDDSAEDCRGSDEDEEEEEAEKEVEKLLKKKIQEKNMAPKSILKKPKETTDIDPEEKKRIAEAAKKEIPYTFDAPSDLEDLTSLLSSYSPDDQVTVVERLVACHHPSLVEGNKQKLQLLFSLLLQYLMELMSQESPPVLLLDKLTPLLHQLLRHDPDKGTAVVKELLLNRYDEFQQICQRRKGRGRCMGLDSMLLLKLVSVLYPTSDFKHPVVTPALHFMTAMLNQTPVQTERDIATGLYLCTLCLEYVSLSKRYIPEVINFLHGLLFLAAKKDEKKAEKVFPPFKPVGKFSDLLKLKGKVKEVPVLSLCKTLAAGEQQLDTDDFRVSCISACVRLLQEYCDLHSSLPAAAQIFAPVMDMIEKVPSTEYPQGLQECIERLKHTIKKDAARPMKALTRQKEKPQPLQMIEPKIEEVFDGRKKRKGTKEQLERQRLKHKIKKEFKGALREIRKDARFLANEKLVEIKKNDAERQAKLKRLYADLATQEGDVRALKRKKNQA